MRGEYQNFLLLFADELVVNFFVDNIFAVLTANH
jgi:hypothetical protein